jgi:peptidoglycan/xylan/chitin deacetylase (PgdA/CDA1 family)
LKEEKMKRIVTAVFVMLTVLCTVFGCSGERRTERDSGLASALRSAVSPNPVKTAALWQRPVATPEPTQMPRVNADWYVRRNTELKGMLRRNGSFAGRKEIEDAVDKMFIDPNKPMVALTFDDGPMPGVTDKILDTLERYNVRATFFIIGARMKKPEVVDIVRRAMSLGCEIGNHTWEHEKLTEFTRGRQFYTIERTNEKICEETGYVVRDLRPPGGYCDIYVCRVAEELGMAVVKWAQSGDVMERDPEKIAENVEKQIVNGKELQAGDIILLHDTKSWMVDAVEIIVPRLLEQGYQLVTAWELINCSEQGFVPGMVYHHS